MNAIKTIVLFLLAAILLVGVYNVSKDYSRSLHNYENQLIEYNQKLEKHRQDSIRLIQSISAPRNAIQYPVSSAGEAYQSASQGIEVQLKGLSWRGYFRHNPAVR